MSSDAASIQSLKKALTGAVAAGKTEETKNILEQLKTDVKATEELLRETKIGLTVGKLRSNDNKEVAALAKELVKKWKEEVGTRTSAPAVKTEKGVSPTQPNSAKASPSPAPGPSNATAHDRKPSLPSNGSSSSTAIPKVKPEPPSAPVRSISGISAGSPPAVPGSSGQIRTTQTDNVDTHVTEDKTRNKCIELVYDSLAMDTGADSSLILQRSIDIESSTFRNISDVGQYRAKMRSLYLNLKDKSNPALRASILSGDIDGKLLWSMSATDMASAEKKKELEGFTKDALFSATGAAPKKSETDMFQCGKCRKRRCTYYQMQTRSADEPMTTFVTCIECGHNWRFS